jgi:hypothetical protein
MAGVQDRVALVGVLEMNLEMSKAVADEIVSGGGLTDDDWSTVMNVHLRVRSCAARSRRRIWSRRSKGGS